MGPLLEEQYTFMIISRTVLLRMRNVSDKKCRENQNTHFVFNKFFFLKSGGLWDNVEKYSTAGHATDESNISIWRYVPKITNTNSEYVVLITSYCNSGFTIAPQCWVILTFPAFFVLYNTLVSYVLYILTLGTLDIFVYGLKISL